MTAAMPHNADLPHGWEKVAGLPCLAIGDAVGMKADAGEGRPEKVAPAGTREPNLGCVRRYRL
jgi:hypothetical protein